MWRLYKKKLHSTILNFHRVGEDHLVELADYSLEVKSQADSIARPFGDLGRGTFLRQNNMYINLSLC